MPTFMTEQIARALYRRTPPEGVTGDEQPLTYGERWDTDGIPGRVFPGRIQRVTALGVSGQTSVLVVGSAFGHLAAHLRASGIDAWGIDPGEWFWQAGNESLWVEGMRERTARDWIGSGTERDSLNSIGVAGAARFNYVIDEDAAPGHSDSELAVFHAGLEERLQGNQRSRIIHLVTPLQPNAGPGDSSQNWKTLTDWQATAPSHTWLDAGAV